MNITEAKNLLISFILSQEGLDRSGNYIESITNAIHKGNFCAEGKGKILFKFFTWSEDIIDGKLYIFVNNLWINPELRNKNSLLSIRGFLKGLYPGVHKGYWFNKRKDILIHRS